MTSKLNFMEKIMEFILNLLLIRGKLLTNAAAGTLHQMLKKCLLFKRKIMEENRVMSSCENMLEVINYNSREYIGQETNCVVTCQDYQMIKIHDHNLKSVQADKSPLVFNNAKSLKTTAVGYRNLCSDTETKLSQTDNTENDNLAENLNAILKAQELLLRNIIKMVHIIEKNTFKKDTSSLKNIKEKLIACEEILSSKEKVEIEEINKIIEGEVTRCRFKTGDTRTSAEISLKAPQLEGLQILLNPLKPKNLINTTTPNSRVLRREVLDLEIQEHSKHLLYDNYHKVLEESLAELENYSKLIETNLKHFANFENELWHTITTAKYLTLKEDYKNMVKCAFYNKKRFIAIEAEILKKIQIDQETELYQRLTEGIPEEKKKQSVKTVEEIQIIENKLAEILKKIEKGYVGSKKKVVKEVILKERSIENFEQKQIKKSVELLGVTSQVNLKELLTQLVKGDVKAGKKESLNTTKSMSAEDFRNVNRENRPKLHDLKDVTHSEPVLGIPYKSTESLGLKLKTLKEIKKREKKHNTEKVSGKEEPKQIGDIKETIRESNKKVESNEKVQKIPKIDDIKVAIPGPREKLESKEYVQKTSDIKEIILESKKLESKGNVQQIPKIGDIKEAITELRKNLGSKESIQKICDMKENIRESSKKLDLKENAQQTPKMGDIKEVIRELRKNLESKENLKKNYDMEENIRKSSKKVELKESVQQTSKMDDTTILKKNVQSMESTPKKYDTEENIRESSKKVELKENVQQTPKMDDKTVVKKNVQSIESTPKNYDMEEKIRESNRKLELKENVQQIPKISEEIAVSSPKLESKDSVQKISDIGKKLGLKGNVQQMVDKKEATTVLKKDSTESPQKNPDLESNENIKRIKSEDKITKSNNTQGSVEKIVKSKQSVEKMPRKNDLKELCQKTESKQNIEKLKKSSCFIELKSEENNIPKMCLKENFKPGNEKLEPKQSVQKNLKTGDLNKAKDAPTEYSKESDKIQQSSEVIKTEQKNVIKQSKDNNTKALVQQPKNLKPASHLSVSSPLPGPTNNNKLYEKPKIPTKNGPVTVRDFKSEAALLSVNKKAFDDLEKTLNSKMILSRSLATRLQMEPIKKSVSQKLTPIRKETVSSIPLAYTSNNITNKNVSKMSGDKADRTKGPLIRDKTFLKHNEHLKKMVVVKPVEIPVKKIVPKTDKKSISTILPKSGPSEKRKRKIENVSTENSKLAKISTILPRRGMSSMKKEKIFKVKWEEMDPKRLGKL